MVADGHDLEFDILATLQRMEALLRILVKLELRSIMDTELTTDMLRKLYEMTGATNAREITRATGLGLGTVSRTWSRWEQLGLVIKDGKYYRKSLE